MAASNDVSDLTNSPEEIEPKEKLAWIINKYSTLLDWALGDPQTFEKIENSERRRIAKQFKFTPFKIEEWDASEVERYLSARKIVTHDDLDAWPCALLLKRRKRLPAHLARSPGRMARRESSDSNGEESKIQAFVCEIQSDSELTAANLQSRNAKLAGRISAAQLTKEVYEKIGWNAEGILSKDEKQAQLREKSISNLARLAARKSFDDPRPSYQQCDRAGTAHIHNAWIWALDIKARELVMTSIMDWTPRDWIALLDALEVIDYADLMTRYIRVAQLIHRKSMLPGLVSRLQITGDVPLPDERSKA